MLSSCICYYAILVRTIENSGLTLETSSGRSYLRYRISEIIMSKFGRYGSRLLKWLILVCELLGFCLPLLSYLSHLLCSE